jgi:hypothetical protein
MIAVNSESEGVSYFFTFYRGGKRGKNELVSVLTDWKRMEERSL